MKTAAIAGIALIILGVISLAYQGITYTTHKKVLDIGPLQATTEEQKTIPLPPILGGIALVGGIGVGVVFSLLVEEKRAPKTPARFRSARRSPWIPARFVFCGLKGCGA